MHRDFSCRLVTESDVFVHHTFSVVVETNRGMEKREDDAQLKLFTTLESCEFMVRV